MCVKGVKTSTDPQMWWQPYSVYGLWLNDPDATDSGIGANIYVTAETFNTKYFLPMMAGSWEGKYVAILEPPKKDLADIHVSRNKTEITTASAKAYKQAVLAEETVSVSGGTIQRAEQNALNTLCLLAKRKLEGDVVKYDSGLFAAYYGISLDTYKANPNIALVTGLIPRHPRYVINDGGDYYLVPFRKQEDPKNTARIVVVIDAAKGSFEEASWNLENGALKLVAYPMLDEKKLPSYVPGLKKGQTETDGRAGYQPLRSDMGCGSSERTKILCQAKRTGHPLKA